MRANRFNPPRPTVPRDHQYLAFTLTRDEVEQLNGELSEVLTALPAPLLHAMKAHVDSFLAVPS